MNATFGPFKGVNNTSNPAAVSPKFAAATDNGYFDDNSAFIVRPGHDVVATAPGAHSLFVTPEGTALFAQAGTLYGYDGATTRQVASGLGEGRVRYAEQAGETVVSANGVLSLFDGAALQPLSALPPAAPSLTILSEGSLRGGRYGVALVGRTPLTGLGAVSWVYADNFTGIEVAVPDGDYTVYATGADGADFYRLCDVAGPGAVTFVDNADGPLCPVQFCGPAPQHDGLWAWQAYLLVRSGCNIHLSKPYSRGLFDWRDYLPFPEPVTQVFPLPSGLFVQTAAALYWVAGTERDKLEVAEVHRGAGVLDCGVVTDAVYVNEEKHGKCAVGMIGGEFFIGYEDGSIEWAASEFRAPAPGAGQAALVRFNGNPVLHFSTR